MVYQIDKYYKQVSEELLEMGYLVDKILGYTYNNLNVKDHGLSEVLQELTSEFYMKEEHVQNTCYSLMIRRQPVASDFRDILALLQISASLKRIVDYSVDMNEMIEELHVDLIYEKEFEFLYTTTASMVIESLSAFHLKDREQANLVIEKDDAIDFTFDLLKGKIIDDIVEKDVQGKILLDYFMLAKYYERIGDRAVSVSKSVLFAIHGK